ncbi:MAG: DUF4279 domain-containing protein [Gammaproteobacteria bacterium]
MSDNSTEYFVSLRFRHPDIDPQIICDTLNLSTTSRWRAGEPRTTPKGTLLEGYNKESYCAFRVAHGHETDVSEIITPMNQRLEDHADFLRQIRSTGGRIEYYVSWYCKGNCGESFRVEVLHELASLGIGLAIECCEAGSLYLDAD